MNASNLPEAGAAAVGVLWILVCLRLIWDQKQSPLPRDLPTGAEREAAAERLWQSYPDFPDEEPLTALFLAQEARKTYDGWLETSAKLESKATSLVSFLAAGAGLLTVLGSVHGEKTGVEVGPFLGLAIFAGIGCLLACLYLLRTKLRPHPTIVDYVSPAVAISPMARFHLALSLAEGYNISSLEIARLRRFEPVAWTVAQLSLAVAVVAILMHFWIGASRPMDHKSVVYCRSQSAGFHTERAWKTACKEP